MLPQFHLLAMYVVAQLVSLKGIKSLLCLCLYFSNPTYLRRQVRGTTRNQPHLRQDLNTITRPKKLSTTLWKIFSEK